MTLKFYKTKQNEWFVDLPAWEGEISDLQMVCGADTMLDIFAQGDDHIWLTLATPRSNGPGIIHSDNHFTPKAKLTLEGICGEDTRFLADLPSSGAVYQCHMPNISVPVSVWLCDVTKFVFGKFPEFIYIY